MRHDGQLLLWLLSSGSRVCSCPLASSTTGLIGVLSRRQLHWAALESARLEEVQGNLPEILAGGGPDSDDVANALRHAGLFYLVDNEDCVAKSLRGHRIR